MSEVDLVSHRMWTDRIIIRQFVVSTENFQINLYSTSIIGI